MTLKRQKAFRRNPELDCLLEEINSLLGPAEAEVIGRYRMPRYPVILVVGAPRSGTTLMLQWLASTGEFSYPTNLLSRFYGAPYIGARIQQLLTDPRYSFRNEFQEFTREISFESHLGKTKGILAPNEFWYFWRRFIPNTKPRFVTEEELAQVDGPAFAAELAALEAVFEKPWAMKGMILELNLPFLSSLLDKVLFLYIRRNPYHNIQSLLEARVKYFGHRQGWYSVKPREYEVLSRLSPVRQVAGQIYFTNRAIEEGLAQIDPSRSLRVTYEDFCAAPHEVYRRLTTKLAQQGYDNLGEYVGPTSFQATNQIRLPPEDCQRILAAYQRFSGMEVTP